LVVSTAQVYLRKKTVEPLNPSSISSSLAIG
jgi:hypothetical protein